MISARARITDRFESDSRFLNRIEQARQSIRDGKGIPLEKLAEKLPASSRLAPRNRRGAAP